MLGAATPIPIWVQNLKHHYEQLPATDGGGARGFRRCIRRRIDKSGQSWNILVNHLIEFNNTMRLDELYTGGEVYLPVELMADERLKEECRDRGTTKEDPLWNPNGTFDADVLYDFLCTEHQKDLELEVAQLAPRIIPRAPPVVTWEASPESNPEGLGDFAPAIGRFRTTYGQRQVGTAAVALPPEAMAMFGKTLYLIKSLTSADEPWRGLTAAAQPAMIQCTLAGAVPISKPGSDLAMEGCYLCHPFTRFELEEAKWKSIPEVLDTVVCKSAIQLISCFEFEA